MNGSWGPWTQEFIALDNPMRRNPAFSIKVETDANFTRTTGEAAQLDVGYIRWNESFYGKYTHTTCQLLPAVMEYDVVATNTTIGVVEGPEHSKVLHIVRYPISTQTLLGSCGFIRSLLI
jgi:hypothetical protein